MSSCFILIPPSEGKLSAGHHPPLGRLNDDHVTEIYRRLNTYSGDLGELYGVKGKALTAACLANQNLLNAPTAPAIERYTGVVYDGIDYPSLPEASRKFFNRQVRIVSALFGLLKPTDLIPDYKLKIEKLDAHKYWQPVIAEKLQGSFMIDLLPKAHQKAVRYKEGIAIDFIVKKKGKAVPAGHQGKLIKGKFVRWLCLRQTTDPKDFKTFQEDGFRFDGQNFVSG